MLRGKLLDKTPQHRSLRGIQRSRLQHRHFRVEIPEHKARGHFAVACRNRHLVPHRDTIVQLFEQPVHGADQPPLGDGNGATHGSRDIGERLSQEPPDKAFPLGG